MDELQDAPEVLETPVEETTETTPVVPEAPQVDEEKEALRKKNEELENKNKQLFERAKKAETKPAVVPQENLSNKDLIYLAKADIHQDDVDDVLEMARFKKIPVAAAHDFMKPILDTRAEERTTASIAQKGGGARGSSKVSGEDLLIKALRTNELPNSDEGMTEIFKARRARLVQDKRS